MLDKIQMNTLLDFYGGLLTPKQQEICRFYYREDLSLTEIAELQQVSRAAVHDSIKGCSFFLSSKRIIRASPLLRASLLLARHPKVSALHQTCKEFP